MHKGRPVGSIGQVGCWSLQGTKPVSAGEGGVLATNDVEVFDRACLVGQVNRMAGMDLQTTSYEKYQPLGTGMKLRAHPLGIGVALVQLRKLQKLNEGRGRYVEAVEAALAEIPGVRAVPAHPDTQRGGYYAFPIHGDPDVLGVPVATLIERVRGRGIPATGSTYQLLHRMPLFSEGFDLFTGGRGPLVENWVGYAEGDFPVAERLHRDLLFLPMLTDPAPGAVERIIAALAGSVRESRQ
jgi:dTDP-4-amino-4,6-dideoxygalactose transaminase